MQIAEELRSSVHSETGGLTCSAGVAANRLLAKVHLICGKYYIYLPKIYLFPWARRNLFSESTPTILQVCSDINKPNGQFVLQNDRSTVMTFISLLPIRKVWDP